MQSAAARALDFPIGTTTQRVDFLKDPNAFKVTFRTPLKVREWALPCADSSGLADSFLTTAAALISLLFVPPLLYVHSFNVCCVFPQAS